MIQMTIAKHAVAFPSKVLARDGGKHIYNIQLAEAADKFVDNGWFVAKNAFIELDLYKAKAPTSFEGKVVGIAPNGNYYVEVVNPGDALFVYNVPMIEEEYNKNFQKESNYYIPAEVEERAYPVREGDIWELSKDNFTGVPTVGKTITSITGKKWVIA